MIKLVTGDFLSLLYVSVQLVQLYFLTRSFSVLQPVELLKRSSVADGHLAAAAVLDLQITRQLALALL